MPRLVSSVVEPAVSEQLSFCSTPIFSCAKDPSLVRQQERRDGKRQGPEREGSEKGGGAFIFIVRGEVVRLQRVGQILRPHVRILANTVYYL